MPDTNAQSSEDLAGWLQEVARRSKVDGPLSVNPAILAAASPQAGLAPRRRRHLQHARDLVALAALSIGYLQYYYLDVMVQIGGLHQVVVFVPLKAA